MVLIGFFVFWGGGGGRFGRGLRCICFWCVCLWFSMHIGWLCAYLIVCGIDFLAGLACLAGLVRRACFLIGGTPRC